MIVLLSLRGISWWSVVMLLRFEMFLEVMIGCEVCVIILCSSFRLGFFKVLFFVMLVMI